LVFIGPRGVAKASARGLFHCPHCDISRPYAFRRVRRYFAFLFVPVVPLGEERRFVQCGFCRRTFDPAILESHELRAPRSSDTEPRPAPDPELAGAAASTLLVWDGQDPE